jgi:hypothetical protein
MSDSELKKEFRKLGNNLKQAVNAGWESEERQQLQQEIQDGISELGSALIDFGIQVQESETVQKVKGDLEDLSEQVHSDEVQDNARAGVISALQRANSELEHLINMWKPDESSPSDQEGG